MLQPPLLIAMKAPQLWTNAKNGHTGQVGLWGAFLSRCIFHCGWMYTCVYIRPTHPSPGPTTPPPKPKPATPTKKQKHR